MIPFKKINLGNSYELLKPYFDSGFIGLGDAVFDFEKQLAEYVGAKYVVALSSCTAALFLSLLWEKEHGVMEVGIPDMTVPLVADAVLQAGLKLRFNADVSWVGSRYFIEGTKNPICDSAHQLRRHDFDYLDANTRLCFSFYPTKSIGSADGGAIATNDKEFADWARQVALYGRTQKQVRQNNWEYDVVRLGYKFNWNNLQAVIASEQLSRLDDMNDRRQTVVQIYNRNLNESNTSDYLYRIRINRRDEFLKYMLDNGVECGVHFQPLHTFKPFEGIPVYESYPVLGKAREFVEEEYANTVSLPLYDSLTPSDALEISNLVLKWEFFPNQT